MTVDLNEYTSGLSNYRLFNYIVDNQDLTASQKLVALTIARHRNQTTPKCCPSISRLQKLTNLDRATVWKSIKHLERADELLVKRNNKGPKGRACNHYLFTFDAKEALDAEGMNMDWNLESSELLERFKMRARWKDYPT